MPRILDSWRSSFAPWAVFPIFIFILIFKLFHKEIFDNKIQSGFAAYFLVVACFVFFGSRVRRSSSIAQISAASSIGISVWIVADIYFQPKDKVIDVAQFVCNVDGKFSPKNSATPPLRLSCGKMGSGINEAGAASGAPSENPLEKINVFAAVLAAVLTALTFIAQKIAGEVRADAERAQQLLTGAWDIRLAAMLGRISLEAQRIRNEELYSMDKYASLVNVNLELAGLHMRWAELLGELHKLLVRILHSVEEDGIDELNRSCGLVEAFVKDIDKAHRDYVAFDSMELLRAQSRLFVVPLRQLLKRTVDILGEGGVDGIAADNVRELATVMRRLNGILRELG